MQKHLQNYWRCSVCQQLFEPSDDILSCQHLFCKKCLREITESRRELWCPKCFVLENDLQPSLSMPNTTPQNRVKSPLPSTFGSTHYTIIFQSLSKDQVTDDFKPSRTNSSPAKQIDEKRSTKSSMKRYSELLKHVCQCKDINCCRSKCSKIKQVLEDEKNHKIKKTDLCSIYKHLLTLCIYHVTHCKRSKCSILCRN